MLMVGEWGRVWMGDLGWLGGGLGKAVGEGDIHSATTHFLRNWASKQFV